jgi:hypothetical protein
LCVRGGGNFSLRLYETLLMGRIPIFINTDCLLPPDDSINWKQHVVWVEWEDRRKVPEVVSSIHAGISEDTFVGMQRANRELWKTKLSVAGQLRYLAGALANRSSRD